MERRKARARAKAKAKANEAFDFRMQLFLPGEPGGMDSGCPEPYGDTPAYYVFLELRTGGISALGPDTNCPRGPTYNQHNASLEIPQWCINTAVPRLS